MILYYSITLASSVPSQPVPRTDRRVVCSSCAFHTRHRFPSTVIFVRIYTVGQIPNFIHRSYRVSQYTWERWWHNIDILFIFYSNLRRPRLLTSSGGSANKRKHKTKHPVIVYSNLKWIYVSRHHQASPRTNHIFRALSTISFIFHPPEKKPVKE